MHIADRTSALRRRGPGRSARALLALALITSVIALGIVRAAPAKAESIERFHDEIVFTSDSMRSVQTSVTLTVVVRRDGYIQARAKGKCDALTRKFAIAWADITIPSIGFTHEASTGRHRVPGGGSASWSATSTKLYFEIIDNWDAILADPNITFRAQLDVSRI